MRLSTLNEALATCFVESSDVRGARRGFEAIFFECVGDVDAADWGLLDEEAVARALRSGNGPGDGDFAALSDRMDSAYLDAEDEGRDDAAGAYFRLARLMSALDFAQNATTAVGFAEAAYEAIMSLPDPRGRAERFASTVCE